MRKIISGGCSGAELQPHDELLRHAVTLSARGRNNLAQRFSAGMAAKPQEAPQGRHRTAFASYLPSALKY